MDGKPDLVCGDLVCAGRSATAPAVRELQGDRKRPSIVRDLRHDLVTGFQSSGHHSLDFLLSRHLQALFVTRELLDDEFPLFPLQHIGLDDSGRCRLGIF